MTEPGKVSDGYHTFDELYEHRAALFIALARCLNRFAWKSHKHADGSRWEGYFVAGIDLPIWSVTGISKLVSTVPITYHMQDSWWDEFDGNELELAPPWDGHTPDDVVARLREWASN